MSGALVIRKDAPPEEPEAKLDVSIFDASGPQIIIGIDPGIEDQGLVRWDTWVDIARMVYVCEGVNAANKTVCRFETDYYELEMRALRASID